MSIGDPERVTQAKVIKFFKDQNHLDYTYLGNLEDYDNPNIREDLMREYLHSCGYSQRLIDGAIEQIVKAANDMSRGIYDANKQVYSLMKYGAKVEPAAGAAPETVMFIDTEHPTSNHFAVAEEVTVVMTQEKRPDVVIYLNGIAVAIIELKKSSVSVATGIRQNLTNQMDSFIQPFFSTVQFCMAGNEIEGLRYGTLLTKEKFYMEWKKDGFEEHEEERCETDIRIDAECENIDNKLLSQLYAMFDKTRFIDLIENFIVFDKGVKKVCRYNQYYAIKRAQVRLLNGCECQRIFEPCAHQHLSHL